MIEKRCWFLFVVLVVLQGCSVSQIALRLTLPLVDGQLESLHEEEDPVLAERAIPAQMKMLEGFLKVDESNVHLLDLLAEGFCGYAFSFVEEKDRGRASALYLRGKGYALRALEKQAGGLHWVDEGLDEFRAALERLPRKSLPALFWLGQCWGRWLVLNMDNVAALAEISKVEAALLRVLDMDPAFHHAGPHVALGSFYGSRTRLLGGDPERARRHFERSLKLTRNKFLLNQVLYAQTYAVQTQDRELFEKLLNEVVQAASDILPRERLANEVAKIKAKKLLRSADDLF